MDRIFVGKRDSYAFRRYWNWCVVQHVTSVRVSLKVRWADIEWDADTIDPSRVEEVDKQKAVHSISDHWLDEAWKRDCSVVGSCRYGNAHGCPREIALEVATRLAAVFDATVKPSR